MQNEEHISTKKQACPSRQSLSFWERWLRSRRRGYDRESDEMLTIQIPGEEYWDADREEFICRKATTLALEHSLLSLTK